MSEYKIRPQRKKRRNNAPYRRKNEEGLVSRVWSWLTPSTWWTRATSPSPSPSPPPPPPPPPPLSIRDEPPVSNMPQPSSSKDVSVMITEPSAPLLTADTEQGSLVNGMETADGASWVAEDVAVPSSGCGQNKSSGCGLAEHTVQNPAFGAPSSHTYSPSLFSSGMRPPGSGFTTRGLRTRPLLTSTPQMSPVNESDKQGHPHRPRVATDRHGNGSELQNMQSKLPTIPEQSPFHAVRSTFHATHSTARTYTDLSLSRSPFQSPFYSGRTAYGGAASGQRLRTVKRPRTEANPPVLAPVQMTVTARPHPSAPPLSSSTARKILHTLDSLSSPLSDARKLPLRDRMPSRKRHKSAQALSPPPVASLSTPSLHTLPPSLPPSHPTSDGPVIVPNEKTSRPVTMTTSSLLGVTLRPGGEGPRPAASSSTPSPSPSLVTSAPPSKLASLTFSALPRPPPPPPSPPQHLSPDHSTSGRASFMPTFHAANSPSPLATSGGKMKYRSLRTHHSHHHDDQEEGPAPVAMVPSVGLQMKAGSLSSFQFTQSLEPLKSPTTLGVVMVTEPPLPNFSFSTPKLVTSSDGPHQAKKMTSTFQFSTPTPCSKTTPPGRPAPPIKATPPEKQAPPLKTVSVVDILKQADYQTLTSGARPPARPPAKSPVREKGMILTTTSSAPIPPSSAPIPSSTAAPIPSSSAPIPPSSRTASTLPLSSAVHPPFSSEPVTAAAPPPLSVFAPPVAGWQCQTCLVHNSASATACVACSSAKPAPEEPVKLVGSLLAQFAPPPGSWECSVCMVQNKTTDSKCLACASPKPGCVVSGNQATDIRGGLQLGSASGATPSQATPTRTTPPLKPLPQFAPAGGWTCDACLVSNKISDSTCVACGTARIGGTSISTSLIATTSTSLKVGAGGGLKLGGEGLNLGGGGLKFSGEGGSGGLKLGGEGLKLAGEGLKLGGEGLKLGGQGLKFGAEGMEEGSKIGGGGFKLGTEGLKEGSGGLKLGGEGLKRGGGLKFGSQTLGAECTAGDETGSGMGVGLQFSTNKPISFGAPSAATPLTQPPSQTAASPSMFLGATQPAPMFSGDTHPAPMFSGATQPAPMFSGATQLAPMFSGATQPAPMFSRATQPTPMFSEATQQSLISFSGRGSEQALGSSSGSSSRPVLGGSGGLAVPLSSSVPTFSFGGPPSTLSAGTASGGSLFNFSAAKPSTSQSGITGFNFTGSSVATSSQASNTGFSFTGAATTQSSVPAFNFTGSASQTSQASLQFGASTAASTSSFNFSGPSHSSGPAAGFQAPPINQTGLFLAGVPPATAPGARVIRRARRRK